MKKNYILFILTLTFSYAQAQWAGFNNNGGDGLWSNDANWGFPSGVTTLASDQNVDIYIGPTDVTLDEDYTAKRFRMPAEKTESVTLTGDNTLTIDVNDGTVANNDLSAKKAIWNESTIATTLSLDCDVTIANSATPDQFKGVSVLSITHADSKIDFAAGRTLHLGGTATTSFWGAGEFHLNGNITGTNGVLLGADAKVFFGGATSDLSGYTGAITLANGSELTLKSNGSSKIATSKIQNNGTNGIITLESANVITPQEIRVSFKDNQVDRSLTLNVNADQSSLGAIKLTAPGSTMNLNIGAGVTSVVFWANNANWNDTAVINITGFTEGVVKFGADASSLNDGAYLANIRIDGAVPSEPLALDASGKLYYASTTLSVKDHAAFEFGMYPNPVKDILHIHTEEQLQKIEVADLLGRSVFTQNSVNKNVDISSLKRGMYILKLTSEKGISTKKIIKE